MCVGVCKFSLWISILCKEVSKGIYALKEYCLKLYLYPKIDHSIKTWLYTLVRV